MFIDIILKPKSGAIGTYDTQAFGVSPKPVNIKLYPRDNSRGIYDVQLRPANRFLPSTAIVPLFPTQFSGFKIRTTGSAIELCLVATADAPTGMGGSVRINKNGTVYAVYLVETTDPNASPVRVKTTTGVKSARLKT